MSRGTKQAGIRRLLGTVPSQAGPRRGARLAGTALALAVLACLGPLHAAAPGVVVPGAAAPDRPPYELIVPYDLDQEVAAWGRAVAPPELPPLARLRAISRALLDPRRIGLRETLDRTLTAGEAFRQRRANCVGFASLFVGLAREAGVPAFFVMIEDLGKSRRQDDLLVREGHLAAAWGPPRQLRIFDFAGESDGAAFRLVPVTDLTVIALYHSNRGVESLLEGRDADAARWLRRAVDLDPSLAAARINLGVTLRRLGDLEGAEAAYQEALRVDPGAAAAARSLAALWRLRGRSREAEALLADARRMQQGDALSYLNLARRSLTIGRVEQARSLYRKALELSRSQRQSADPVSRPQIPASKSRRSPSSSSTVPAAATPKSTP